MDKLPPLKHSSGKFKFVATFVLTQFTSPPNPNIKLGLVYNKTGSHFRLYFFLSIFL